MTAVKLMVNLWKINTHGLSMARLMVDITILIIGAIHDYMRLIKNVVEAKL